MTLDRAVASAVARAKLLEAALHSIDAWHIEIGGRRFRAHRKISEHGVTFRALAEDVPTDADTMLLFEGAELRSAQPFLGSGYTCFEVSWDLGMQDLVRG